MELLFEGIIPILVCRLLLPSFRGSAIPAGIDRVPDAAGDLPLWQPRDLGDDAAGSHDRDGVEVAAQTLPVDAHLVGDNQIELFFRQLLPCLRADIVRLAG